MAELVLDEAALRERVEQDSLRLFLAHLRGTIVALAVLIAGMVLAWQDYAPLRWRLAWAAGAMGACLAQGWVGWRLERATDFAAAMRRWLPWLHASVLMSSVVWGLVPWMVSQGEAAELPLLLACAFNVTIVFAGAHAPGMPGLVLSLSLPASVLGTLTVASRSGHVLHALACGLLFGLVSLYGWRMQVAIRNTLVARRSAEALGEALRAQQQLVHEAERERALLLERQRLMRDMHDGVGSTLIAMLRLSESGGASAPAMAELLRSAIEDLRLTIDSLEPMEHDLATLLATLRTRVGRRLEAAGLTLEWAVADMPPLPWLEPTQALQVLRLVQEAVTNVIKHARAQTLSVSARPDGDALEVCIADDGCGFDPGAATAGRGLASMRQRAQALGAALCWHGEPGQGTRVSLRLPLRPSASA
ncbi:sensor histidine kinase [Roseateles sp. BYS78W]|uniref:histidine kinase n=1 Tax=Pelomonas candidula TaxID=3299025 RepID=A0ABW7H9C8_9BURK